MGIGGGEDRLDTTETAVVEFDETNFGDVEILGISMFGISIPNLPYDLLEKLKLKYDAQSIFREVDELEKYNEGEI